MIWLTTKFWPWLKKNWKWILFPVGIAGAVVAAIGSSKSSGIVGVDHYKLEEDFQKRDEALAEAEKKRDEKLLELAEKNKERLDHLSEDQEKELEDLANKPIEEVVAWFDKF